MALRSGRDRVVDAVAGVVSQARLSAKLTVQSTIRVLGPAALRCHRLCGSLSETLAPPFEHSAERAYRSLPSLPHAMQIRD